MTCPKADKVSDLWVVSEFILASPVWGQIIFVERSVAKWADLILLVQVIFLYKD
jgi:hypothetical protein